MQSSDTPNPLQKQAVETVDGRVLVLAGAGSGKTRVLTLRMSHLIRHHSVSPRAILGLTFTNKAAAEMRYRIAHLVGHEVAKQITLSTFHSFCMQILRSEIHRLGYTKQFTLWDEKDLHRAITTIARDQLEYENELPSLNPTIEAIALAKNKGLKVEEMEPGEVEAAWHDGFVKEIYRRLKDSMRAYNAVDFDDLLNLTVELFEKFPDVLDKYQERFRYLMIDEYQDTNPIQYKLASLLSAKYGNLCVVGDDDQSIYGWRGAEVKNILDFNHAAVIKLEQNYRSTNTILKAANAVISHNKTRYPKALWSNKGEGNPIEVFHAPNEVDEAQAVVCRIDQMRTHHGLAWGDIAILYRSNALSRSFELALLKHAWQDGDKWVQGIPYKIHGGVEFYERREIKDLMAYLRVIVNPLDQEALLRIINYPRRGIGEGSLDLLTAFNRSQNLPLIEVLKGVVGKDPVYSELKTKLPSKCLSSIQSFLDILEISAAKFSSLRLEEAMTLLIEKINYQKALDEEVKSTQMRQFKWENVQEFVSSIAEYQQRAETPSLHEFILSMPLQNRWEHASTANDAKENKVILMTFHSAKGLEFPACFLVGMEDHIIPHEKSMKQTGVEEERRLMYVAITRAMRFLTISMAQQRKRMGVDSASTPSRFLFEIPKELMKITKWHELEKR